MAEPTYTLHPYDHRFDAGLAQMWNESDEQWPGTFTDGVPFTEERVRDWMNRVEAIIRFIIVEDQTGKVVGYGDLWDTPVRPKSCYVALLNVHPEHQGRSLARRMLVQMVDWAVEHGYDRLTIGTWPSNLKAMPLYKKVGFFWKPGTTVFMENYLTAARLLPAAQPYFSRHSWYDTYRRDLTQVEDDQTHPGTGDTKVYVLRWEADGDLVEAIYDRNSQALTGLETNDWAVYACPGAAEPAQGLRYPFHWEFRNKSARPLPVALKAQGDAGISLEEKAQFTLAPGECRKLESSFVVDAEAPKYRGDHDDLPTPQVRTSVEIDGLPVQMGAGLRYSPPATIRMHPPAVNLVPGVPQTVHIQLSNATQAALKGRILLDVPEGGPQPDWTEAEFEADPQGYAGFPLTLTAGQTGFTALSVRAALASPAEAVTSPMRLPVTALDAGGVAGGMGEEELILENDFFRITVKSRAGEAVLFNKGTGLEDCHLTEEIGPAFVPRDLDNQEFDLHVQTGPGEVRGVLTARSMRFPGLVVGREITVNASPLIRVRNWVANNTEDAHPGLELRSQLRMEYETRRTLTAPLREHTVQEHGSQFAIAEGDLPKEPERYAEEWVAYEEAGCAFGFVWPAEGVKQLDADWGQHFTYFPLPIEPGTTHHSQPFYLYCGPGDWRAVRRAWLRLRGLPASDEAPALTALGMSLDGGSLVTLGGAIDTCLHLRSTRSYELIGEATVQPPAGWKADFAPAAVHLDAARPVDLPLRLQALGPGIGAGVGEVRFETQISRRTAPFTVIRLGVEGAAVDVAPGEQAGQPVWTIDSGSSLWTVTPAFQGGVTFWQDRGSSHSHLLTAFPVDGELSWMKPFFGGIRPALYDPDAHGGWPGVLHREAFHAEAMDIPDDSSLPWRGVRLTAEIAEGTFRGLQVSLDYLALPGGNVLKAIYRLANPAPVYRKAAHGFLAFHSVDGSHEKAVLHTPEYSRKRTPHSSWGVHRRWSAVENPETGRALVTVHATGRREMQAIDLGRFGAHTFVREVVHLPPEGAVERVAYYVLAEDLEQARAYEALAES